MKVSDFEILLEGSNADTKVVAFGSRLLDAINDWPEDVSTLQEFDERVRTFLGCDANRANMLAVSSKLDLAKEAWYAESLHQVGELLDLSPESTSLSDIIGQLEAGAIGGSFH